MKDRWWGPAMHGWGLIQKYLWQFVLSSTLLVVAGGVALLMKANLGEVNGVIFITMLLFPLAGYLVLADKLSEISLPGGVSAKFRNASATPPIGQRVSDYQDNLALLEKGSSGSLRERMRDINPDDVASLVIKLNSGIRYNREALRRYLCAILTIRYDSLVIFIDERNRFIGSVPATQVHSLFCDDRSVGDRSSNVGDEFIRELNSQRTDTIRSIPLARESLRTSESRKKALELFQKTNVPALVVVDSDRKPKSIVVRDVLITTLLLSLAGETVDPLAERE